MKLKSKLTATIVSMCAAIAVMGVGVWASTSQSFRLTVQNDIDIKINSVIADVWGEYAVYTEMMEEVSYQAVDPTKPEEGPKTRTDQVPGLLRWRTAESAETWKSDPDLDANDMIGAQADYTANNCYILYTQYGSGYNDGESIVYNEDADWDKYAPETEGSYPNQSNSNAQDGDDFVNGDGTQHNGGQHSPGSEQNPAQGGVIQNNPNSTQPGNWKDVFVPGHDYNAENNPLPYAGMENSGLKNYLNFANFQYLDSGDTGSLPNDSHPNIPYPDTYNNIDYTTSYAQIVYMYTIRQYYVPGADNTIYLTVQDEVTDAFAQEITDTAGLSRVQRNYYLNYDGGATDVGYGQTVEGKATDSHETSNNFFDTYGDDGTGSSADGVGVATQWTALDAGVKALAGEQGSTANADTLREAAEHYELPNPKNNGVWAENKDHVWHLMCVYTFERTSTNVDLSGLADGIGHSLSLLTNEQLEQYYEIPAAEIADKTIQVGEAKAVEGTSTKATFNVNDGQAVFNVAMKNNANFAFAARATNGRAEALGRSPVTIDNYDGCEVDPLTEATKTSPTKDQKLSTAELATGFQSVFGLIENPNARYAFRFSDMVRERGGSNGINADNDWYDLYEPNRHTTGTFTDYQGTAGDEIKNIIGTTTEEF